MHTKLAHVAERQRRAGRVSVQAHHSMIRVAAGACPQRFNFCPNRSNVFAMFRIRGHRTVAIASGH
jgi:hypothetical protein